MSQHPSPPRSFASNLRYDPAYGERCVQALETALAHTPAYAGWRRFDPGPQVDVFTRLAALPALTKGDLRAYGPHGVVPEERDLDAALARGEVALVTTSGTTSDRVTNVWCQSWWDASEQASWQLNAHTRSLRHGLEREAILTSPWCAGFPCEEGYLPAERRRDGRFLYLSERSNPSTWTDALLDRMVAELNAFRPATLEANPSFLARLARHIVRHGSDVHQPTAIVLTYENPSALHRRQIAQAFAAPIVSSYGSTEAGYVFVECEAGSMHQVCAACHVDYLPLQLAHGGRELGRILVTTFHDPWRALLRFDIGDVVRLRAESCPCGNDEGLTLLSIEGRTVNLTRTPAGRAVTQGMVDRALAAVHGLQAYQLVQTGLATYHLLWVADEDGAGVQAAAALVGLYGPAAQVTAERVGAIAPEPPGKYRLTKATWPLDADALLDGAYAPRRLQGEHR